MAHAIKHGDCFEFNLPNGRTGYAQLLTVHPEFGHLVRVFKRTEPDLTTCQLQASTDAFPPVFVGLPAAVRTGLWRRIGNLPVSPFDFPHFRWTFETKPGTHTDWRIWDGKEDRFVGTLPVEARDLELRVIWGAEGLADRLATGESRGDRMR